ncbi:general stress protein [Nocardia grenadensis]
MTESSGGASAVDPSRAARRVVATFDSHADAGSAVDHLSDQHFAVNQLAIVARDLQLIEQVVGRFHAGLAALLGVLMYAR